MKIALSRHVVKDKIPKIKTLGWIVTKSKILQTIRNPLWKGAAYINQETAMSLLDKNHILRVIFKKEGGIITVITIHPARRGSYESTKED